MKKSQVTVFVIIGIVLVAVFALLIYQSKEISKKQLGGQEDVITQPIDIQSVKSYITSCLDKSLANGLQLLGDQGGYIFSFEPGSVFASTENPKMLEFTNPDTGRSSNVSYLLPRWEAGYTRYEPVYSVFGLESNHYPCGACASGQLPLGVSPLYCSFNIFTAGHSCRFSNNLLFPRLERSDSDPTVTRPIKFQLENFIKYHTIECINITEINLKTGMNVSLDEPNTKISVVFSTNGVSAFAKMPVTINATSTQSTSKIDSFEAYQPVRLAQIYHFVEKLVDNETTVLDHFPTSTDPKYLDEYRIADPPAVKVYAGLGEIIDPLGNRITLPFDDVISIIDSKSTLFGQPYVFRFARQNRPPVLSVIHEIYGAGGDVWTDYDFVALPGSILTVTPTAIDPDEDILDYHYTSTVPELQSIEQSAPGTSNYPAATFGVGASGSKTFTVSVTDGQFYDWQLVRLLVLFESPRTPECQNGQYIRPVLYCNPSDPTACTDQDPSGLTGSFTPVLEWSGCSDTTSPSTALSPVLYCAVGSGATPISVTENWCCNVNTDIPPTFGGISNPCEGSGYDSECTDVTCVDTGNDICSPKTGTPCSTGNCIDGHCIA